MPAVGSSNAVARLTVEYARTSQRAYNVFWYRAEIVPDSTNREDVAASFAADILVPLANLMVSQWVIGDITIDVVNGTLAPLTVASGVGAGAVIDSQPSPNYLAFPVRLVRTTRETRSGWKRFPGAGESMVEANAWAASVITAWEAFAPQLADPFQDSALNDWEPVLVRTTLAGVPIESPASYVYNPIAASVFVNRATTQNSRKPW